MWWTHSLKQGNRKHAVMLLCWAQFCAGASNTPSVCSGVLEVRPAWCCHFAASSVCSFWLCWIRAPLPHLCCLQQPPPLAPSFSATLIPCFISFLQSCSYSSEKWSGMEGDSRWQSLKCFCHQPFYNLLIGTTKKNLGLSSWYPPSLQTLRVIDEVPSQQSLLKAEQTLLPQLFLIS